MTVAPAALFTFEDTYAQAVPSLSMPWTAAEAADPQLLVLNDDLAADLGVDPEALRQPAGVALLTGRAPDGVTTVAQAYAGHQFGSYSPRLGDGRALLLGEVVDAAGGRRDVHLKGSGRTPFARGGDGLAAVGPMLREYLMGEAMHALGIPTTRGLSVVSTGSRVLREQPLPGAVLCRVADSHLRVGTFQYAAANGGPEVVQALADYAIGRHYPQAAEADNPYLEFLIQVTNAQARLVAQWMSVGFIHGVMNTDNMTISGQSIDYGPCAFMDAFDPATVFSSIDAQGRYAYANQPPVAQWNLARLAETLLPLIDADSDAAVETATAVLNDFVTHYDEKAFGLMSAKLGLAEPNRDLVRALFPLLHEQGVDYTGFFRALADGTAESLFADPQSFSEWAARRDALLPADRAAVPAAMNQVNPIYIPRNHRVEEALDAATAADLAPFHRLLDAVSHPFDERPDLDDLVGPAPAGGPGHVTYCGT